MIMEDVWYGQVTDVDHDLFTAILARETATDNEHELLADFSMADTGISVEPGDMIRVTHDSVTKVPPPTWTQEEIDLVMKRARKRSMLLRRNVE